MHWIFLEKILLNLLFPGQGTNRRHRVQIGDTGGIITLMSFMCGRVSVDCYIEQLKIESFFSGWEWLYKIQCFLFPMTFKSKVSYQGQEQFQHLSLCYDYYLL